MWSTNSKLNEPIFLRCSNFFGGKQKSRILRVVTRFGKQDIRHAVSFLQRNQPGRLGVSSAGQLGLSTRDQGGP